VQRGVAAELNPHGGKRPARPPRLTRRCPAARSRAESPARGHDARSRHAHSPPGGQDRCSARQSPELLTERHSRPGPCARYPPFGADLSASSVIYSGKQNWSLCAVVQRSGRGHCRVCSRCAGQVPEVFDPGKRRCLRRRSRCWSCHGRGRIPASSLRGTNTVDATAAKSRRTFWKCAAPTPVAMYCHGLPGSVGLSRQHTRWLLTQPSAAC
jgi:hypothetical protein